MGTGSRWRACGNHQLYRHRLSCQLFGYFDQALQVLGADPIELETVAHFQYQPLQCRPQLQRADPGGKLLRRHLLRQHIQAGLPQGSRRFFLHGHELEQWQISKHKQIRHCVRSTRLDGRSIIP